MSSCEDDSASHQQLDQIKALYTALAHEPHRDFGWGKGKENARSLGYAQEWLETLPDAVWGAIGGYLSLWLVYWAFKLATGKEGMGYGDFKLFAALGAWFGWQALVPIILMASVIGALVGIGMKLASSLRDGGVVPFGPFLAMGGLTAMIFGPQSILRVIGL